MRGSAQLELFMSVLADVGQSEARRLVVDRWYSNPETLPELLLEAQELGDEPWYLGKATRTHARCLDALVELLAPPTLTEGVFVETLATFLERPEASEWALAEIVRALPWGAASEVATHLLDGARPCDFYFRLAPDARESLWLAPLVKGDPKTAIAWTARMLRREEGADELCRALRIIPPAQLEPLLAALTADGSLTRLVSLGTPGEQLAAFEAIWSHTSWPLRATVLQGLETWIRESGGSFQKSPFARALRATCAEERNSLAELFRCGGTALPWNPILALFGRRGQVGIALLEQYVHDPEGALRALFRSGVSAVPERVCGGGAALPRVLDWATAGIHPVDLLCALPPHEQRRFLVQHLTRADRESCFLWLRALRSQRGDSPLSLEQSSCDSPPRAPHDDVRLRAELGRAALPPGLSAQERYRFVTDLGTGEYRRGALVLTDVLGESVARWLPFSPGELEAALAQGVRPFGIPAPQRSPAAVGSALTALVAALERLRLATDAAAQALSGHLRDETIMGLVTKTTHLLHAVRAQRAWLEGIESQSAGELESLCIAQREACRHAAHLPAVGRLQPLCEQMRAWCDQHLALLRDTRRALLVADSWLTLPHEGIFNVFITGTKVLGSELRETGGSSARADVLARLGSAYGRSRTLSRLVGRLQNAQLPWALNTWLRMAQADSRLCAQRIDDLHEMLGGRGQD